MAQLTVRNVDDHLIKALKLRAAHHGRSAEAEHRAILREALKESRSTESFADRAAALRKRLRAGMDSTDLIRADRDRDTV